MSRILLVVLAILTLSCVERGRNTRATNTPPAETPRRPGIRFDPSTLAPGARVGELVCDSVSVQRAAVDSSWVGLARFRGELVLRGRRMQHFEPDVRAVCFEADTVSAARMPRWEGDERRPWFCFTNLEAADPALPVEDSVTVVVDEFTIHQGHSDQVNAARFVRVEGP